MTSKASVVTPERYASGFTYKDYIAQIKVNKDWFQRLYEGCRIKPEDAEFFRKAGQHPKGPASLLVLGEDWCPDVYRGMPVLARIAEAGGYEMRVFPRDANMDIMNEYLKEGLYSSIPTAVFYTRGHDYICHWIERPALADREMKEIAEQVEKEMPGAQEQQTRAAARPRNQARFSAWQQDTVREIREMLSRRTSQ